MRTVITALMLASVGCADPTGPKIDFSGSWNYSASVSTPSINESCSITTVLTLQHVGKNITGQTNGGTATCNGSTFPLRAFTFIRIGSSDEDLSFDLGTDGFSNFGREVTRQTVTGTAILTRVDLGSGREWLVSGDFTMVRQ